MLNLFTLLLSILLTYVYAELERLMTFDRYRAGYSREYTVTELVYAQVAYVQASSKKRFFVLYYLSCVYEDSNCS